MKKKITKVKFRLYPNNFLLFFFVRSRMHRKYFVERQYSKQYSMIDYSDEQPSSFLLKNHIKYIFNKKMFYFLKKILQIELIIDKLIKNILYNNSKLISIFYFFKKNKKTINTQNILNHEIILHNDTINLINNYSKYNIILEKYINNYNLKNNIEIKKNINYNKKYYNYIHQNLNIYKYTKYKNLYNVFSKLVLNPNYKLLTLYDNLSFYFYKNNTIIKNNLLHQDYYFLINNYITNDIMFSLSKNNNINYNNHKIFFLKKFYKKNFLFLKKKLKKYNFNNSHYIFQINHDINVLIYNYLLNNNFLKYDNLINFNNQIIYNKYNNKIYKNNLLDFINIFKFDFLFKQQKYNINKINFEKDSDPKNHINEVKNQIPIFKLVPQSIVNFFDKKHIPKDSLLYIIKALVNLEKFNKNTKKIFMKNLILSYNKKDLKNFKKKISKLSIQKKIKMFYLRYLNIKIKKKLFKARYKKLKRDIISFYSLKRKYINNNNNINLYKPFLLNFNFNKKKLKFIYNHKFLFNNQIQYLLFLYSKYFDNNNNNLNNFFNLYNQLYDFYFIELKDDKKYVRKLRKLYNYSVKREEELNIKRDKELKFLSRYFYLKNIPFLSYFIQQKKFKQKSEYDLDDDEPNLIHDTFFKRYLKFPKLKLKLKLKYKKKKINKISLKKFFFLKKKKINLIKSIEIYLNYFLKCKIKHIKIYIIYILKYLKY